MAWVGALVAAAGAAYGDYSKKKAAKEAAKTEAKNSSLATKEGFQRQAWLDQQDRKYALEDRKYKEDAMGGFRNAGPYTEKMFPGFTQPQATSTTGLADWNPENGIPGVPLMNIQTKGKANARAA